MNDFNKVPYAEWLEESIKTIFEQNPDKIEVIFNVFKDSDYEIYRRLLR